MDNFTKTTITALLAALLCLVGLAPCQTPAGKKAEDDRQKSEFHAQLDAESEQRKAVVKDLIDTYSKCLDALKKSLKAEEGSQEIKLYTQQTDQCYETWYAKIDRAPIKALVPDLYVTKGMDLRDIKRDAFLRLYDAYEYGVQNSKCQPSR
jgi:hypothetical protein